MRIRQFVVSLFIILYALPDYTCAQSIDQDSLALVEFYNANNGSVEWGLDKWLTDAPLREWQGLTVEGDSAVTKFHIRHKPIRSLRHLGQLQYLKEVNLALTWVLFPEDDSLYFSTEFAGLQNIERLLWTGANFKSELRFYEISKLKNLIYLDLAGSHGWKNPVIYLKRISQLTNLVELRLSRCGLNGIIPNELIELRELEVLTLQDNEFAGEFPQKFSEMENLQMLNISGNSFEFIPYIPSVTDLDVSGNNLTFSSLLQYADIPRFVYDDQKKIASQKIVQFDSDTSFTLTTIENIDGLLFNWYRNGEIFSDFPELEFREPTPEIDGVYYYDVAHSALPNFKLVSFPIFLVTRQSSYSFYPDTIVFEDDTPQTVSITNSGAGTIIVDKIRSIEPYGWNGEIEIQTNNQPCSGSAQTCRYGFSLLGVGGFTVYNNIGYVLIPPNSEAKISFNVPDLCPVCKTISQYKYFEDSLSIFFINPKIPTFKIFASGQGIASSVNFDNQEFIESFVLSQNYPNPFNPETTIKFNISHAGFVKLGVYNILGKLVRMLLAEEMQAGEYSAAWNSKNNRGYSVSSGVYIYKLQVGSFTASQKMILLR